VTAVEVCIANAERLLGDSLKTSPPSAASLAELSIEEAAKAWMVYFKLLSQGRRPRFSPRLTKSDKGKLEAYLSGNVEYLKGLDKEIFLAFKRHKVKLRFLAFLLGYLEVTLPLLATKTRYLRNVQSLSGPAFKTQEPSGNIDVQPILNLIKSFRLENLTELDSVKQSGFYVNLAKRGDLVSPEVEPLPFALLQQLAVFLIAALKGELQLLTK